MPATYEPIATTTLGTATNSIVLSSIPATYTDLRLTFVATSIGSNVFLRLNGDAGTNYSATYISGAGTSVASSRLTSTANGLYVGSIDGSSTSVPSFTIVDLFSYAGSTNKVVLSTLANDGNGTGDVRANVALWRNTAAINQIEIRNNGAATYGVGATVTLYGILKA